MGCCQLIARTFAYLHAIAKRLCEISDAPKVYRNVPCELNSLLSGAALALLSFQIEMNVA